MSLSIENLKESDEVLCDQEKSFSTEQLFSFALQIAKGMVNTIIFWTTLINKTIGKIENVYF